MYAHYGWWRSRQAGTPDPAAEAAYDSVLAAFEARHGEIVRAYWCSHVESAAALTERRRLRWLRTPISAFHRESDWATQNAPDIAAELHRCDELAVRARDRADRRAAADLPAARDRLGRAPAQPRRRARRARATRRRPRPRSSRNAPRSTRPRRTTARRRTARRRSSTSAGWSSVAVADRRRRRRLSPRSAGPAPVAALDRGRDRRRRERDPADQHRPVRSRVRRRPAVRVLPRRAAAADRRRLRDDDRVRVQRAACCTSRSRSETTRRRRTFALLVIGFLAGFSERFAQDTLAAVVPSAARRPPRPDSLRAQPAERSST